MHVLAEILASVLDPSENGFDVADASTLVVFIAGLGALIAGILKVFESKIRTIVRDEITHATAPIQAIANGGLSLPDVARTTDWNKAALTAIANAHGIDLPPDPHEKG
jgi:hypothetical protein